MKGIRAILLICLAAVGAGPAAAQVGLPPLPSAQLPQVPAVERTVQDTLRTAQSLPLAELRKLRVQELLKTHRGVLEADPDGHPVVRGQVGALAISDEALARAIASGFRVVSDRTLEGVGLRLVVLEAPPNMSTRRALRNIRRLDPEGTYDYNHVYLDSGMLAPQAPPAAQPPPAAPPAPRARPPNTRIGLIDSGVDDSHPALRDTEIRRFGCEGRVFPAAHGTAVASLLVGQAEGFRGVEPGARLYAADIFCGQATGGSISLLALALDWMARERVPVINISLVGANSALLTGLVRVLAKQGFLMVAAVGNDGPSAPPLYPAAYPEVIGVTGVDARQRVLPEACRGPQVAFAAPGADMRAANPGGTWAAVRGTSFATPIVAGMLAAGMTEPDRARAVAALERLAAGAIDLGRRGQDPDYGKGLVGFELRTPVEPASQKKM